MPPHNGTRVSHMSRGRRSAEPPNVGVDVGGTWIRVIARRGPRTTLRARVPATRVRDLGTFLHRTLASFPRPSSLVVASRGVWTVTERRRVARNLRTAAARVHVISDAQAALLGALGERPGVLILAGTGSIALARDARGRWARAGGLGPLLGDEGSAFWLGRAWLRATSEGEDFMPARRLIRAPDAIARIAALAPRVIRQARAGEPRARRIVRDGQAHLAAFAVNAARKLRLRRPIAMSWAGRLLADDWFRGGVVRAVARAGVRARWLVPASDAVTAAADLAARLSERSGVAGAARARREKRAGVDAPHLDSAHPRRLRARGPRYNTPR